MSSVNKVILVGRLGKDPEVRYIGENTAVANFSLATSETYKNRNGDKVETTEWHNIVVWRKLAEIAEKYLTKGKLIYVEGKLRTRNWDDKEGNKRYTTEVIADNFTMLGPRSDSPSAEMEKEPNIETTEMQPPVPEQDFTNEPNNEPNIESVEEDDLPF